MPHLWNEILVVKPEELKPWFKAGTLAKTIQRYKDKPYGIKRATNGHNGQSMLINYDTLPVHIQQALGDPRKCDHVLERFYKADGEAVAYYTKGFQFEDGSYLDLEYQEKYILNASVLSALLKLREARINERVTKGGSLLGLNETLHNDALSFQGTLKAKHGVLHTLPESYRRFMETLKDFERNGYRSLISDNHKNQKARKVTDETLELLQNMFAKDKQKPTATEVHRRYSAFIDGYIEVVNTAEGEVYNPADFKKLSDATVKKYIAKWENKIGSHAVRSGDRQKFIQQFKPYHSLEKPKLAGSIISIDDRQPPFKTLNGKRVWFYNAIDLASEAFTCWVYGETKEGIITEFYRQLIRNYHDWGFNLPLELEAEMSLNSSFVNTFLREGAMFKYVRIEANNARGKRIERYYGNLRYGIEKQREGWLARPFALSESNQAGPQQVPALPYSTVIENGLEDIQTWNNQPHSVHTHISRWEYFCTKQNPDTQPTNYQAILPHIGNHTSTSCRAGIIQLDSSEFLLGIEGRIALGGNLISLMKQVEGQKIDIYWIDDNNGRVLKALVFIGTQYICEAIAKPTYQKARAEQTEQDEVNRSLMSAYVATIESFGRRRSQEFAEVLIIDQAPAPKKDFVMPGLKQRTAATGEQMPHIPDQELDDLPRSTGKRSLLERF